MTEQVFQVLGKLDERNTQSLNLGNTKTSQSKTIKYYVVSFVKQQQANWTYSAHFLLLGS